MNRLCQRYFSAQRLKQTHIIIFCPGVQGAEPDMTNCDAEAWKGFVHEICVDYFWYTQDLTPSGVLATPSRESMRKHLALPSVLHPSDHIPLLAGFKIL